MWQVNRNYEEDNTGTKCPLYKKVRRQHRALSGI